MLIVKQEGRSSLSERTIINHRNVEKSRLRGGNADPGWEDPWSCGGEPRLPRKGDRGLE